LIYLPFIHYILSLTSRSRIGQLLPEKPGQNSRQANCGIFRLATVWCLLCESYTQFDIRPYCCHTQTV